MNNVLLGEDISIWESNYGANLTAFREKTSCIFDTVVQLIFLLLKHSLYFEALTPLSSEASRSEGYREVAYKLLIPENSSPHKKEQKASIKVSLLPSRSQP